MAVTGGTGYVASWVIRELLARGVDVRATVRDRSDTGKHQHLLDLAGQLPGTLELFDADLLAPGSFDACFAGCEVVVHTASPFATRVKDPQRDLVDPAVQGTRNVLGPALSARPDGTSVDTITKLLDGTRRTGMPDMYNPVVDVREVATAHAEAAVRDDAEGRHIIAADVASFVQIAEELRVAFPSRPLPRRKLPTPLVYLIGPIAAGYTWGYLRRNLGHPFTVDNSRSRDRLGLHYRPLAETLRDQGRQLIDMGLV